MTLQKYDKKGDNQNACNICSMLW